MTRAVLLALLPVVVVASHAGADGRHTLAVLEFRGETVSPAVRQDLSIRLEEGIARHSRYLVLPRSEVDRITPMADTSGCTDVDFAVESGRQLKADLVVLGFVEQTAAGCSVSVYLVDVGKGKATHVAERRRSDPEAAHLAPDIDELARSFGTPMINPGMLVGQYLLGQVGEIAGLLIGSVIDENPFAIVEGAAIGVGFAGSLADQTGSYPATRRGAYIGGVLGLILTAYGVRSRSPVFALVGVSGPTLGAMCGFNWTRRYNTFKTIAGDGLFTIRGGRIDTGTPVVSCYRRPSDGRVLRTVSFLHVRF